ncbi:MAG: hypothetical protein BGO31_01115 [Bacteroidetes bacterium 43-16]|nr:MAG: hypothetical protein BGO31_01115 [Bacteroidetes bacterium 43-16]
MKSVRKDYLLVLFAALFAVIIGMIIFNVKSLFNNSFTWQVSLFAAASSVLFSMVRMYQLSQKVSEQLKLKKAIDH